MYHKQLINLRTVIYRQQMITDQLFKSFIQNNIKYAQILGGANTDHDINLFPDSAFILW